MTKTVTHIEVPKEWKSINDYDSHRELLYLSITASLMSGIVIECGVGYGSTELLSTLNGKNNITVMSFDTDAEWAVRFNDVKVIPNYQVLKDLLICNLKEGLLSDVALLFVDGKPGEERKGIIKMFSNKARVIIAHDTEPGANYVYGMADILSTFKYRLDYTPEGKPHTTAVSNFIDVTKWVE